MSAFFAFFLSFNLFIYFYSPGGSQTTTYYLPQCHQVTKKKICSDVSSFLLIYIMAASSPHPPIFLSEEAFLEENIFGLIQELFKASFWVYPKIIWRHPSGFIPELFEDVFLVLFQSSLRVAFWPYLKVVWRFFLFFFKSWTLKEFNGFFSPDTEIMNTL